MAKWTDKQLKELRKDMLRTMAQTKGSDYWQTPAGKWIAERYVRNLKKIARDSGIKAKTFFAECLPANYMAQL